MNVYVKHLSYVTPEFQSLSDTWLDEVCYEMLSTFHVREKPRAPKRLKSRNENYNFFTFENVMGVLDPEMTDPKEEVLKYGKSP